MPRRPRIHLAGEPLHIVQRGHNCQPCFYAVAYYLAYLEWLEPQPRGRPRKPAGEGVPGAQLALQGLNI